MLLEICNNNNSNNDTSSSSNLTRQPTYENLPEIGCFQTPKSMRQVSTTSSSSSSSCCSCHLNNNKGDDRKNVTSTTKGPKMRAPLIDLRTATNKTKLGKVVGARAGWFEKTSKPSVVPLSKIVPSDPVIVVSSSSSSVSSSPIKQDRPPKLCSHRLHSVRSVFDGFALSILKTGTVVLEKLASSRSTLTSIREIVQVSADGEAITTAKLRQHVAFDNTRATTIDKLLREGFTNVDVETYRYDTMPPHLYGRYRCAANFVNLSRAKTPKIIINKSIKGKIVTCSLMESLVDCVVTFGNESQQKCVVTFLPDKATRIQAGTAILTLAGNEDDERMFSLPKQISDMLAIARGMRSAAVSIEKSISNSQQTTGLVRFPIECGQRRTPF